MTATDRGFEVRLLVILLTAVAVFAFWVIPASVKDPAGFGYSEGLAPSFSVYLVAVLAAITLSGRLVRILIANGSTSLSEPALPTSKFKSGPGEDVTSSITRTTIIVAACLLFPYLLIPFLGFYISSFGFVLFMAILMGERRLPILILLPVLLICGIFAGFELGFTIFLPRGELIPELLELIEARG